MEIEVGEYVRTKRGEIFKVAEVVPTLGKEIAIVKKENGYPRRIDLKKEKHSKIISEVVEVGDYVNGKLIHKIDKGENYCYLYYGNCKTFVDYQIKTILTKELYQSNCYTVERKEEC